MALITFSSGQTIRSADVNSNFTFVQGLGAPTGSIMLYGGTSAPTGWLLCNGSAVNRTTYADLFAILSTTFGVGDGASTFNLPDLQDKFPIGKSGTKALGSTGGSATHTHTYSGTTSSQGATGGGGDGSSNTKAHSHTYSGTSAAESTLPSYQAFNYIIKT